MTFKETNNKNFDSFFKNLLRHEGTTFVNHPKDPGGATQSGITLRAYRLYVDKKFTVNQLKNLTEEEISNFYFTFYWDKPKINELPPYLASFVFDCSVNHGQRQAVKFLQKSLNITQDGVIGPITIKKSQEADPLYICKEIASQRAVFYGKLSTFKYFGLGWMRRNIEQLIISLNVKF